MYMEVDKVKEAMDNQTEFNSTRSLIPKRIPMDSSDWFKTFGKQQGFPRNSENIQSYYAEGDFMFYFVASLIVLLLIVAIIGLYGVCCVWVMKVCVH